MILKRMAIATSITMIASLVSCSSAPTEKAPPPAFHFTSIALVIPQEFVDASRPKTRGQKAQEGAAAGLLGGTLGGAAAGAIEQSLVEVADQVVAALNHRWEPKSG